MKTGDIVIIDRDISNSEYFDGKKFGPVISGEITSVVLTEGTELVITQVGLEGISSSFDYRAYRLRGDVHDTFLICDSWLRPILKFEAIS